MRSSKRYEASIGKGPHAPRCESVSWRNMASHAKYLSRLTLRPKCGSCTVTQLSTLPSFVNNKIATTTTQLHSHRYNGVFQAWPRVEQITAAQTHHPAMKDLCTITTPTIEDIIEESDEAMIAWDSAVMEELGEPRNSSEDRNTRHHCLFLIRLEHGRVERKCQVYRGP